MKHRRLIILMTALLIVSVCSGCSDTEKEQIDLVFSCYEMWDGNIQEDTVLIRAEGYLSESPDDGTMLLLNLHFPDDYRYGIGMYQEAIPLEKSTYSMYNFPYIALATTLYDGITDNLLPANYAISIEDGYFFLQLSTSSAHYLVGSVQPDATAQAILDYFQDFISILIS